MAWSWDPSCDWGKLDNISCMCHFQVLPAIHNSYMRQIGLISFKSRAISSHYVLTNTYYFMFAVQDIALYASNGCYYSVRAIYVSICIRHIRVLPLSLLHTQPLASICKRNVIILLVCFLILLISSCVKSINVILYLYCWSKNVSIRFARRTDVMPVVPLETKYHPSAVDLLLIKRLIGETTKQNLLQFLQHEFVNIGKSHAERLIGIKFAPPVFL